MAKTIKKTGQPVGTPRKNQKTKDKGNVHVQSALQARVVKRTEQRDEAQRKLSQTRSTFDTLFEANPIPTALTRLKDGSFINVNAAFLRFFDLQRAEVIDSTVESLKIGIDLGSHERIRVDELQKGDGIHNYEWKILLPSGKPVIILVSLQYLCLDDIEAILAAFVDITEQKQAEELMRSMVDAAPDATVVIREDGTIAFVNKQLENVFGYARQDLIGRSLTELIPERFHELYAQHGPAFFKEAGVRQIGHGFRLYGRRWDGTEFPVELSLSPLKTTDGTLAIAAIRDITKRIESERKIRRLASLLGEAEQKERQRISEVLHDDLQQQLFAAKLQLPLLEQAHNEGDGDTLHLALAEIDGYLTESISITRNLSVEFGPIAPREEDLSGALAALSTQMQNQYNLNVTLKTNDIETRMDNRLSRLLYQMIRELLFNVVKHSGTLHAELTLERVNDELRITVSDGGKGFDPTAVMSQTAVAHGLLNIYQRLELLGCRMEVSSQPGNGSRISIYCLDSN